jgi:3-isopropylmalate/(R)-2-methylmalate dehydratase large subunit
MIPTLLEREVHERPTRLRFDGRILFLVDDEELVRRQLDGEDLPFTPELRGRLRDDISTDEITPAYICYYYDETLGEFPYLGLRAGGAFPVKQGDVRRGGFAVSVSGKRRGKGSSREQSPFAEAVAGIRLVIAENIERIYRENCQNLGILTSIDFGLIDRIRAGEEIPLTEFVEGADPITRGIVAYGGLFNYNLARLQGRIAPPAIAAEQAGAARSRPMTVAEKVLAGRWVTDVSGGAPGAPWVRPGDAGFVRTDLRFSHEYVTPMAAILFESLVGPEARVAEPESILLFRDHLTFLDQVMPADRVQLGMLNVANQLEVKQREFAERQGIRLYGELGMGRHGSEAICHSKVLERYALPGQVIIGSDSHTPHAGAIGCVAFGVGTTAIFNSWITRDVRVEVPPSFRVVIEGEKPSNVTAKDFMLEILRHPYVRDGRAIGQIIEYSGSAVEALSVDERATMTNMAAEVGAFTGIVAPDERVVEYLIEQRGFTRGDAEAAIMGLSSDDDAEYVETIEIDAAGVRPMLALPGDPGNGLEGGESGAPVEGGIAYAGSCTAGKKEDMDMYARVLREYAERGVQKPERVQLYIQCGSQEVFQYCRERGYDRLFDAVGATFIEPSCGACINAGPDVSRKPTDVTISAINRNFPGRSGPGRLYLASPYTVAASAMEGRITAWTPAGVEQA